MKTLIEDLKKVITSDIVDKDKYCEKLINGFLTERESEQLLTGGVSKSLSERKVRCCGRCDGMHDLCFSDMTCDVHNVLGCEECYGKR